MEWINKFNSFNSMKALAWREYFEVLAKGEIPKPISLTVDATNKCNLNCIWCHYREFRSEMQRDVPWKELIYLLVLIPKLEVKSVCLAGGGEFLLHPLAGDFMELLHKQGLEVGMITNGVLMDKWKKQILKTLRWIGISVDASRPETYEKLKGKDQFRKVIDNISDIAVNRPTDRPFNIGFKFLIHPLNYGEIYEAAELAKSLGVDEFHARPCYNPGMEWTSNIINDSIILVKKAQQAFDEEGFRVYGITHKFDDKFVKKIIPKCEVTPLAGLVFAADGYCYICCDLRGEKQGKLCKWDEILQVWGSEHHKEVLKNLNPNLCPHRCTYSPYQTILDEVFKKDKMTYKFI